MYSLECPHCGQEVFEREEDWWTEGEETICECGCPLMVSIDDWDPDESNHTVGVQWDESKQLCPDCNPTDYDYEIERRDGWSYIDIACPECDKVWIMGNAGAGME